MVTYLPHRDIILTQEPHWRHVGKGRVAIIAPHPSAGYYTGVRLPSGKVAPFKEPLLVKDTRLATTIIISLMET